MLDVILTVLIWLGSGFAFAVGIVVGVWLVKPRDTTAFRGNELPDRTQQHRPRTGRSAGTNRDRS